MIGRGPLTVRDLRALGVKLHEYMGIRVQTMRVPTTDYITCFDRLNECWENNHRFRHNVSVARIA